LSSYSRRFPTAHRDISSPRSPVYFEARFGFFRQGYQSGQSCPLRVPPFRPEPLHLVFHPGIWFFYLCNPSPFDRLDRTFFPLFFRFPCFWFLPKLSAVFSFEPPKRCLGPVSDAFFFSPRPALFSFRFNPLHRPSEARRCT